MYNWAKPEKRRGEGIVRWWSGIKGRSTRWEALGVKKERISV
jgi:hypothetical protein